MAITNAEKEPLLPVVQAEQPVLTRREMRDSFLRGFLRAFSLIPLSAPRRTYQYTSYSTSTANNDEVAGIAGDWVKIGNDLRAAMLKYELGEQATKATMLERQLQPIAEIICPACSESVTVNKLEREGVVVTPCQTCGKKIEVQTDYSGRIAYIGLARRAGLWSLWLTLIAALAVWIVFARTQS
jgi:Zn ribbon nucleic-acid-binding protein